MICVFLYNITLAPNQHKLDHAMIETFVVQYNIGLNQDEGMIIYDGMDVCSITI